MAFSKMMVSATAGAILLGGALAVQLTGSLTAQEMPTSSYSRAQIEEIVREYLLANPEVIFEAADTYGANQAMLAQQQTEDAVRANFATLLSGSAGFAAGASAENADVLVVEFFDYHCGFCRRATDFVVGLTEADPNLRLVLQELPVVHEKSRAVAVTALAAPSSESYFALHRALMAHGGLIEKEQVRTIAKRAKINYAPYADNLASNDKMTEIEAKLAASMDLARTIGIDGTPGFIVASPNGDFVALIPGFDKDAVRAAIAEARNG